MICLAQEVHISFGICSINGKIELPTAENQIVIQYLALGEVRGMRIA